MFMANKIKIVWVVFLVSLLSACFTTDFQPPVGLLATSIKAPLITKLPEKKLLVEKKEDYLTRFFLDTNGCSSNFNNFNCTK